MADEPKTDSTASAASASPSAGPGAEAEVPRTFTGPEVGEIVRSRVARLNESHAKQLATVAERAATAAAARVRAELEGRHAADLAEVMDLAGVNAKDLARERAHREHIAQYKDPEFRRRRMNALRYIVK